LKNAARQPIVESCWSVSAGCRCHPRHRGDSAGCRPPCPTLLRDAGVSGLIRRAIGVVFPLTFGRVSAAIAACAARRFYNGYC
jgi:hypothetical protein